MGFTECSGSWRAIKSAFSWSLVKAGLAIATDRRGEFRLWQRRFWERTIRDEDELQTHVDYTDYNPVKRGLSSRVAVWPYSSIHRFILRSWVGADWGVALESFCDADFGEPR